MNAPAIDMPRGPFAAPALAGSAALAGPATLRWPLLCTITVLGAVFFVTNHDLKVSLAEAYTQTAEEMEIAAGGGNALRRMALFVAAGWGLVLLATSRRAVMVDPLLLGSIALLFGLAGVSCVWADDPGMCLRRTFALLCCAVAALGVARALSLREISWLTAGMLGTLAAIGVLAELGLGTFRPWAGDYRFAGTVHPNTQGPALAALCLAAVGLARQPGRRAAWLWGVFVIAGGLLLLTKSRTTAAGALVALAAVETLRLPLRTRCVTAAAVAWLTAAALWLVWTCGLDPLTDFRDALLLGRAEESDTLSGRAFIWPELLEYVAQRPLVGYGYESFWTPARIETISTNLGWGLREAHNAYLEVLLWLGPVGLAALLLVAVSGLFATVRGFRTSLDPAYTLPLGLLVFAMVNAATESGMVVINAVPFLLTCCLLHLALFREPGVGSRESGIGNRGSGVGNRESGIGSRESGVGNRESGIGSRGATTHHSPLTTHQ